MTVRRFVCRTPACARRTFVEQVAGATARHRRATVRLEGVLTACRAALGGEAGARLAGQFGVAADGDTLLRLLRRPQAATATPRVLGVDDWVRPVLSKQTPESEEERQSNVLTKTITLTTWLSMVGGIPTPV
jgi:hypothetical protein